MRSGCLLYKWRIVSFYMESGCFIWTAYCKFYMKIGYCYISGLSEMIYVQLVVMAYQKLYGEMKNIDVFIYIYKIKGKRLLRQR